MKDVLLLICVASVFAGGYFLMKRLDCFLNSHVHPESERTQTCPCLKIGVADPLMMGSLSAALELFSETKEEAPVRFFGGTADELLREWENISAHSIDHRIFRACALQRIMQMLGAYANIGHNQGKTWYLAQIPAGLGHLRKLLPGSTLAEPLAAMLA